MRTIKEIILHCTATKEGKDYKASDIKRWHVQNNGWSDIGYNFVIDLDGTIEEGRPIEKIPAHCKGHNEHSIGIVYVGGLDAKGKAKDTRTNEQKEAMYRLVNQMLDKYKLTMDAVHVHSEYCVKSCPCFLRQTFINEFKDWKRHQYVKKTICPHCHNEFEIEDN